MITYVSGTGLAATMVTDVARRAATWNFIVTWRAAAGGDDAGVLTGG